MIFTTQGHRLARRNELGRTPGFLISTGGSMQEMFGRGQCQNLSFSQTESVGYNEWGPLGVTAVPIREPLALSVPQAALRRIAGLQVIAHLPRSRTSAIALITIIEVLRLFAIRRSSRSNAEALSASLRTLRGTRSLNRRSTLDFSALCRMRPRVRPMSASISGGTAMRATLSASPGGSGGG
jgi:hypothetical protein